MGTFAIVFFGTGAVIVDEQTHAITHGGVALTFGLVVMSMIYAFGGLSGAHLNPAVTLAFTVARRFSLSKVAPYIVSQFAGAIAASLVLKMMFPANECLGATNPSGSDLQSVVMELLLTFFLVLVILNVATGSREQGMFAGIAIGSVVALEAMFGGPVSGASMNPARSLGPAVVSGHWKHLYIYFTAVPLGAVLAVAFWRYLCPEAWARRG